jgi:hypothetical protein
VQPITQVPLNVSGSMKDPNDFQAPRCRVVNNNVVREAEHRPELQRQRRQIIPHMSSQGSLGEESAHVVNSILNPVSSLDIVSGDVRPNRAKIDLALDVSR